MRKIKKILIVEEKRIIAMDLVTLLHREGFVVAGICASFLEAKKFFKKESADLVFIDTDLKGSKSGFQLAEYINDKEKIPFIFLSDRYSKEAFEKSRKLKPIAYLTKPFHMMSLIASLKLAQDSLFKHLYQINKKFFYCFEKKLLITKRGKEIELTKQEMRAIEAMIKVKEASFVSYDIIEQAIWGKKGAIDTVTRRMVISRINTKANCRLIKAVSKKGYKFVECEKKKS